MPLFKLTDSYTRDINIVPLLLCNYWTQGLTDTLEMMRIRDSDQIKFSTLYSNQ